MGLSTIQVEEFPQVLTQPFFGSFTAIFIAIIYVDMTLDCINRDAMLVRFFLQKTFEAWYVG